MSKNLYYNYPIKFAILHDLCRINNIKSIYIFIDLLSITRGFYNKSTILYEINNYLETKKLPTFMIDELRSFLNNIYNNLKQYSPKFIIFYDHGICSQNRSVCNGYKKRSMMTDIDDHEIDLMKYIRSYYLSKLQEIFVKPKISTVIDLEEYESDLVPHLILSNNMIDTNDNTLCIILSSDKDLLQTCYLGNIVQCVNRYDEKNKQYVINIYNNENAIGYFHKSFERGLIDSRYIPLILSLAGDKSDNIDGIKGVGYAKAYNLIVKHKLPNDIGPGTILPEIISEYRDLIIRNLDLIDFNRQIKRLTPLVVDSVKMKLTNL